MKETDTHDHTLILMHFPGKGAAGPLYRIYRLIPQDEDADGCYLEYYGCKYAYDPEPKHIAGRALMETAYSLWVWKTWESFKRGHDQSLTFLCLEGPEAEAALPAVPARPFRFGTVEETETITALFNVLEHNRTGIMVRF